MKKYILALLFTILLTPTITFAHESGIHEITVDTSFLSEMKSSLENVGGAALLSINDDTKAESKLYINKLKKRQSLLKQLSKEKPALALNFIINEDRKLRFSTTVRKYIETKNQLSGQLIVKHIDDFDNPENSYHEYKVIDSANKENFIYSVKEVNGRSGAKISVNGYKIGDDTLLTDGSSIVITEMPDVGALGKQRMLVLLVNSNAQPAQPFTALQAQDLINNGQFQKFIKEASYGQTWVEAKAYGWIKLNTSESRQTCGFADVTTPEVKDFLIKNQISLINYDRVVFLIPQAGTSCSSVGKNKWNDGIYSKAWIRVNDYSLPSDSNLKSFVWTNLDFLLAHEVGHSLGLLHAKGFDCGSSAIEGKCVEVEYGNNYDAMGSRGRFSLHYNGLYKEILGWIKPIDILNISKSGRYTISNLEATSTNSKRFAKIFNPSLSLNQSIYSSESRNAVGFDGNIASIDTRSVSVKNSGLLLNLISGDTFLRTRLIDTHPSSLDWYEDIKDSGLRAGDPVFVDKANGISIGPVIQQSATSTIFDVNVSTPVCVRGGVLLVDDNNTNITSKNSDWYHGISFINSDSKSCGISVFDISIELPTGWVIEGSSIKTLTINPEEIGYANFIYKIPANVVNGIYNIKFYATNKSTNVKTLMGTDQIEVMDELVVYSVIPDVARVGTQVTINGGGFNTNIQSINFGEYGDYDFFEEIPAVVTKNKVVFNIPQVPNGNYSVYINGYNQSATANITVGDPINPFATSTITNVTVSPNPVKKGEMLNISWRSANTGHFDIDLYDFKGLYYVRNIDEVSMQSSTSSKLYNYAWKIPLSLPDEYYSVRISNAKNEKIKNTSSKFEVSGVINQNVGKLEKNGTTTFIIKYDSLKKEADLVASFNLKITPSRDGLTLINPSVHIQKTSQLNPEEQGDFYVNTKQISSPIVLKKGVPANITLEANLNPNHVFSGQYIAKLLDLTLTDSLGNYYYINSSPIFNSSPIIVIGERGSYITDTSPIIVKQGGILTIKGFRFDEKKNDVYIDGVLIQSLPSADRQNISLKIPDTMSLGYHNLHLTNQNGQSNTEYIQVDKKTAGVFSQLFDSTKNMAENSLATAVMSFVGLINIFR